MSTPDFRIISAMRELDFRQLMDVYEDSNRLKGLENYPQLSAFEQVLMAENDFYTYLKDCFFTDACSKYAVWTAQGHYVAALRMEPYREGLLIEALETAPKARDKGYATALLNKVLINIAEQGSVTLYSHVAKDNIASLAVHRKNGFQRILDYAIFADGSISHNFVTLAYNT